MLNKRLLTFILISITFSFSNCAKKKVAEQASIKVFSYEILKKDKLILKSNQNIEFYVASVLVHIPDSNILVTDLGNYIIWLCKRESIIMGKFYSSKECYHIDRDSTEIDLKIFNKCYLGQIDLRSKGENWKYIISIDDFYYYKYRGSRKIDVDR